MDYRASPGSQFYFEALEPAWESLSQAPVPRALTGGCVLRRIWEGAKREGLHARVPPA